MCFDDDFMDYIGFMTDGTGELDDDDLLYEEDEDRSSDDPDHK